MKRALRLAIAVTLALAGAEGSEARSPAIGPARWRAEIERLGLDPSQVVNPLETTAEMRKLAAQLGRGPDQMQQLSALQTALFDERRFTFAYDADVSSTALEAFRNKRGNCVAFTNLFIALSRAIGVPVRAAILPRDPSSERQGDLILVNTHVVAAYAHGSRIVVYDFYRQRHGEATGVRLLDDVAISAIYHNNRAVARLQAGDLGAARDDLDLTVRLAPWFAAAQGNLGVVLRRLGDTDGAFDAYRHALERAPHDPTILSNLATLYRALGREREARSALAAANLRAAPPHTLLVRGDLEAADGRFDEAIALYKRAHRLDPSLPAPWVAIARVEIARGRPAAARRALDKSLALAPEEADALALKQELAQRGS